MLEEMGHEVCGNESTEDEAVAAAETYHPDLMIIDVNLRIGTGIGAVNKINLNGYIPHVFVSADLTQLNGHKPAAVMLQKPYAYAQLAEAIDRAIAVKPELLN